MDNIYKKILYITLDELNANDCYKTVIQMEDCLIQLNLRTSYLTITINLNFVQKY